jgi:O-antigen/teichoic acid export membrane protein
MINKYIKTDFVKNASILIGGTFFAQFISILISPLLTRIYSPEQMGDLNIYLKIVGFVSTVATARYEMSIPLPKSDSHAYLIYKLAIKISFFILLFTFLLSLIHLVISGLSIFNILFALICLLSAIFIILTNIGTNWAIRKKQFKKISYSRMTNSITSNGLRWTFGVLNFGSLGLLAASLLGYILSSMPFLTEWVKIRKEHKIFNSKRKTHVLMRNYREFPFVNLPHSMIDLGKDLLVAFFIVYFFSKNIFGWFSHSYIILQLPISIIGASIGQVFFNKAAELVQEGKSTFDILKKTVSVLFLIALVPFTVLFFFGDILFAFVFGENWVNAGIYSEIMSIWFFVSFIVSVVSTLPTILKRQQQYFVLGIISSVIQLFCFGALPLLIGNSEQNFISILYFVSISQSLFLIFVIFKMFSYSKSGIKTKG